MTKKVLISLDELLNSVYETIKIDYVGFTDTDLDWQETAENLTNWFNAQPAAPQWVKIEEREPKLGERILVESNKNGKCLSGPAIFAKEIVSISLGSYWMPIPELPEGE